MDWAARCGALLCIALLLPSLAGAWGANAQRLIANQAVETLPPDLRNFYEVNKVKITASVSDPIESALKNPNEARYHVLYLNRYSPFPYDSLPRNYKAALAKFGRAKLESNGLLPWQVGVYSAKLTDAFRNHEWSEVRQDSALLSYYVAETQDPFDTVDMSEPRAGISPGIQNRFSGSLVERYSLFFPMRPNDAFYIKDPTENAFENCMSAHAWVNIIELADLRAKAGLGDYTDEYYDRFYNQAGAVLIRQLSDAATQVGSYWLTSWTNAGKPSLPQ